MFAQHSVKRLKRSLSFLFLGGLFCLTSCATLADELEFSTSRFGPIKVFRDPNFKGSERLILYFIGTNEEVQSPTTAVTTLFPSKGYAVALISLAEYRKELLNQEVSCLYLAGEITRLSQVIEQQGKFQSYGDPLLAGTGEGGLFAYAVALQHPSSFAGLLLFGELRPLSIIKPLCDSEFVKFQLGDKSQDIQPLLSIDEPVIRIGRTSPKDDKITTEISPRYFMIGATKRGESLDHLAHSESFLSLLTNLTAKDGQDEEKLPLHLYEPPKGYPETLIVFFSGDGGWANIDEEVSEYLQQQGVEIVGVNALRYLWTEKKPAEVSSDIEDIVRSREERWGKSLNVVLVGYSLGADALALTLNAFSKEFKDKLGGVGLLSPSINGYLEAHLTDWIMDSSEEGTPLLPEVQKFTSSPLLCLSGEEEGKESLCSLLKGKGVKVEHLPGSHHYNGEYEQVAKLIFSQLVSTRHEVEGTPTSP